MRLQIDRLWTALERVATVLLLIASTTVIWKVTAGTANTAASVRPGNPTVGVAQQQPTFPVEKMTGILAANVVKKAAALGRPTAKIAIVEFADYQCPFCRTFVVNSYPDIKRELIDTGIVRYIAMNFPLDAIHSKAVRAAKAAECVRSDGGRFWELRDKLFDTQSELEEAVLNKYATSFGADGARLKSCLESESVSDLISSQQTEAVRLGINGTPTFLLGTIQQDGSVEISSRIIGTRSVDIFKTEISALQISEGGSHHH